MHEFFVWIEQDEDGIYVGQVPQLAGCYAQGRTLDELMANIREVIELCLEAQPDANTPLSTFVGIQRVSIEFTP